MRYPYEELFDAESERERALLRDKVTAAMDTVGVEDPDLRGALLSEWGENLFGPDYITEAQQRGIDGYLNSRHSLNRVWGAAALLAQSVETAETEGVDVPRDQLDRAGTALASAVQMRREHPYSGDERDLDLIASNVDVLAGVIRAMRGAREVAQNPSQ